MYQKRGEEPPCDTCKIELMEENIDVANIYLTVQSQVIISPGGQIIDISIPAIKDVMDMLNINKNQYLILKRVRDLWFEMNK